jgi:hypothetical protein
LEKKSIETEDEVQEGAGRMPAPQRARRPRYERRIGFYFYVVHPLLKTLLKNTACPGAANLPTLGAQHEVMVLTARGGVSATAGQQSKDAGGENAT